MPRPGSLNARTLAAASALVVLSGVWTWWACKEGAYFGAVMYPGLVVLCAGLLLASSRAVRPEPLALPASAKVALGGLIALGTWSALSALWSPSPDVAIADAQRIFGYALAFGLGIWLCALLRERVELALVPIALAGVAAGGYAVAVLLTGHDFERYIDHGTLQLPIGYRNANAAFFLVAMVPSVTLAAMRSLDWRLRGIALGAATLCLELAMLSQSRGSVAAAALALAVLLIASRERARIVAWLGLAIVPALIVIPALTDLFATADLERYSGTTELRAAGRAALAGALIALALGCLAALAGRRIAPVPAREASANRIVAAGAVAVVLAAGAAFTFATGDPVGWIDDRVDEFLTQGSPAPEGSSRFGVGAGSERDDLWRVALELSGDEPLLGTGGGGYQYSYLIERSEEGLESVRDAHSVELEVLSELGVPGLALFVLAFGGAFVGGWRGRRLGVPEAALATCALTVAAYWLTHASLDWFWTYAGVSAPVFALLGSACGLATTDSGSSGSVPLRRITAAAAVVLALSVVPPYLSERYVEAAYAGWRADPARAEADLERARDLNPLAVEPLLAEGAILRAQGRDAAAIAAFAEAAAERPEEWASHYFLSALQIRSDPKAARAALHAGLELNPLSLDLAELKQRLRNANR